MEQVTAAEVAYITSSVNQLETVKTCCRQAGGVEGIVNGMDTTDWSPNVDKFLDVKYDADTVDEGKALAKEALQAELGLPVSSPTHPVLCMSCHNGPLDFLGLKMDYDSAASCQ